MSFKYACICCQYQISLRHEHDTYEIKPSLTATICNTDKYVVKMLDVTLAYLVLCILKMDT